MALILTPLTPAGDQISMVVVVKHTWSRTSSLALFSLALGAAQDALRANILL